MPKLKPVLDKFGKKVPYLFRKGDGPIYVRKTFKRYRLGPLFESTRETSITRAKAKADELIHAHLNGITDGLKAKRFDSRSVGSVIDEINEVETPSLRVKTQKHRVHYFNELKKELGHVDIRRMDLVRWSTWLKEFRRKKKRTTYWDYAKHMNIILRYAYEQKYISHIVKVKNPDTHAKAEERVFTKEEIGRLFEVMNDDTRDQFVLSYQCYMRLREVLYLTWDRVDFATGYIHLRASDVKTGSKTGRGRTFKASELALKRLQDRRLRMTGTSPYVFPSPSNPQRPIEDNKTAWAASKRRAGIVGRAKWHSLRHTAITHALMDHKVEPLFLSEYAGVSLQTIQKVYLHSTADKTVRAGEVLQIVIPKRCEKGVTKEDL